VSKSLRDLVNCPDSPAPLGMSRNSRTQQRLRRSLRPDVRVARCGHCVQGSYQAEMSLGFSVKSPVWMNRGCEATVRRELDREAAGYVGQSRLIGNAVRVRVVKLRVIEDIEELRPQSSRRTLGLSHRQGHFGTALSPPLPGDELRCRCYCRRGALSLKLHGAAVSDTVMVTLNPESHWIRLHRSPREIAPSEPRLFNTAPGERTSGCSRP
jgi:hypothetical protein